MTNAPVPSLSIKTHARAQCPACGSSGTLRYRDLKDRLFDVPGTWSLRACADRACGTLWLDPAPIDEDLPKLYTTYSTHTTPAPDLQTVPAASPSILEKVRRAYLAKQYGYATRENGWWRLLAYLHPAWRDTQAANIFYLPAKQDGLLLDIGCGSGGAMQAMEQRGWKTIGIDFDEIALAHASARGLAVYAGDVFSQQFPDDRFDAILLNHVIEHIPDPLRLFRECQRILKPGGVVVMLTPNACSRGHARYGKHWRGLETPHHLHVFSPRSLVTLGRKAGFADAKGFSSLQGMDYILDQSAALTQQAKIDPHKRYGTGPFEHRILKQLRWFLWGWRHVLFPGKDEVAVVIAKK